MILITLFTAPNKPNNMVKSIHVRLWGDIHVLGPPSAALQVPSIFQTCAVSLAFAIRTSPCVRRRFAKPARLQSPDMQVAVVETMR